VRFDDRLKTVLAQPAADQYDRTIRWRQLAELVARAGHDADRTLLTEAVAQIREEREAVDERVRTAAAASLASLAVSVELVEAFAADRIAVAAPVLASARLTSAEWTRVSEVASDECRDFIETMRSERRPSSPPPPEEVLGEHTDSAIPSISDVVARIERLRQSRAVRDAVEPSETDESPRLFRWECNESGEIEWVEGAPRGALVGQSISQGGLEGGVDRGVTRAFIARAPFHDGTLELSAGGAIGGTWKISGVPAFEPASGRFAGYRGVAERSLAAPAELAQAPVDPASLRELAHEIRTPLNAIIGFAEIISGEYLGPAEKSYRERANDIVAQARLLLTAVEDLDLAARIRSSQNGAPPPVDIGALAERVAPSLRNLAEGRRVKLDCSRTTGPLLASVEPEVAERLIERMGSAVIDRCQEGEHLRLFVDLREKYISVSISLPQSLKHVELREDRNRRTTDTDTLPLRLVMGLARIAGGELDLGSGSLTLRLPKA
jgi:hypothetical protein